MNLTREYLEQRLAELQAQERQAHANFNAVMGARQFCEGLLQVLDSEDEKQSQEQSDGKRQ